jgi:acetyltransferase-like isoleucine patch superfamily enzyme
VSTPEPLIGVTPPTGLPPSGPRARLRARLAVLRGRGRVVAGPGVTVGRGVVWEVARGARLVLEDGCAIGEGTRFHVTGGVLRLGPGTVLGDRCVFRIAAGADLGAGCRLADEAVLLDSGSLAGAVAPIVLGERVRVGSRTVVHGGSRIGDGAQVAAWLVVEGEVPAGARWDGVPVVVAAAGDSAESPGVEDPRR